MLPQTTKCSVLQKVVGSLQNAVASDINGKSVSYGGDALFGLGSDIRYYGTTISINTRGQVVISYASSNSMNGFVYGAVLGAGYGGSRSSQPAATSGPGTAYTAVGGAAVYDVGRIASGSIETGSESLPAPSVGLRGDFAAGFGAGAAAGEVQTNTVATPPFIPQIPTSQCHL